jgi:hypothetical protein
VLPEEELHRILPDLPLIPATGPWTRAIELVHLRRPEPDPLWAGEGSSRFNPDGAFRRLYLSSDPATALKEAEVVFGQQPVRNPPWALITVEGFLQRILDLTDPALQARLGTSLSELTGSWRYQEHLWRQGKAPMPPTQLLGLAAYRSSFIQALSFHSAKNTGLGANLVVFVDRLEPGEPSFLKVYDPSGDLQGQIPPEQLATRS